MQAFIKVIDAESEDGCLGTTELEKAVGQVKADLQRRYPWLSEVGLHQTAKGGNTNLGDEILRLNEDSSWYRTDKENKAITAFGPAAFTESLLRITLRGLHSSSI